MTSKAVLKSSLRISCKNCRAVCPHSARIPNYPFASWRHCQNTRVQLRCAKKLKTFQMAEMESECMLIVGEGGSYSSVVTAGCKHLFNHPSDGKSSSLPRICDAYTCKCGGPRRCWVRTQSRTNSVGSLPPRTHQIVKKFRIRAA
jgi:hypothetical protein